MVKSREHHMEKMEHHKERMKHHMQMAKKAGRDSGGKKEYGAMDKKPLSHVSKRGPGKDKL